MPTPEKDGEDETLSKMKGDLKRMRGSMLLVESMAGGHGNPSDARPGGEDWKQKHIQAAPTDSMVALNLQAYHEVLGTCGVSPVLFEAKPGGNAAREAYREFLFSTVQPLGALVQAELQAKLHSSIRISYEAIMAADIVAKARSLKNMVDAGMDLEKAMTLSGFMAAEDDD